MSSKSKSRIVVSKIARTLRRPRRGGRLNLMMICCEEKVPYGPAEDTASLMLDLLCNAYGCHIGNNDGMPRATAKIDGDGGTEGDFTIRITVYHAQKMDYPETIEEWDGYDGVIIPGSFSSAYDAHIEWIGRLMRVIQHDIHEKQRKTIGICFGHQAFAHSFGFKEGGGPGDAGNDFATISGENVANDNRPVEGGCATKCTRGPMAGRKSFQLTSEGRALLGELPPSQIDHPRAPRTRDCLDMLYTRGDMVGSIPPVGISLLCGLGGDLPNEACAYFASEEEREEFRREGFHVDPLGKSGPLAPSGPMPYAITFQAHPEFVSRTGREVAFVNCCRAMAETGSMSDETYRRAIEDADFYLDRLLDDSLEATASACVILGWFQP